MSLFYFYGMVEELRRQSPSVQIVLDEITIHLGETRESRGVVETSVEREGRRMESHPVEVDQ